MVFFIFYVDCINFFIKRRSYIRVFVLKIITRFTETNSVYELFRETYCIAGTNVLQ